MKELLCLYRCKAGRRCQFSEISDSVNRNCVFSDMTEFLAGVTHSNQ